ncbi:MAG: FAD-dependent oxidoreductase [Clostridium sp.]|jgi:dihydrolipoamide dehydrogenase|nr:FAD-dependent oxidoreductase [Clostridium sp.]
MIYDLAIIGGGVAGYSAGLRAGAVGLRTVLVERDQLGGTCLHRGCIPTKFLAHAAALFKQTKDLRRYGITSDNVKFNLAAAQSRKKEIIGQLRTGIDQLLGQGKVDVVYGNAYLCGEGLVRVDEQDITAKNILIATGARPFPPILNGAITSDELLEMEQVPQSLTIIGGGVIAVEFADVFNALGTNVTMCLRSDKLLHRWDREISQSITQSFRRRGIKIIPNCDDFLDFQSEITLSATGRVPNTQNLFGNGLEIRVDSGIVVNEYGETNVRGIFAAGDVTSGSSQLAHIAAVSGERAVDHIAGLPVTPFPEAVSCIYISPEAATVGFTESEAKKRGMVVAVGKYTMTANARTLIATNERGFIKLIAENKSHILIGAQLMCERASDMIGELSLAISRKMTIETLAANIRPHPSFAEGVSNALDNLRGKLK